MNAIVGLRFLCYGFLSLSAFGFASACIFSASQFDFPWIVRIMVRKTSAQLCVGNLVSEHFVMSPVSCYRRWSTLPKDYYSAKDLMVIAGRDDGGQTFCSQERPGLLVTAHSNFSMDPHNNNVAILEFQEFEFNSTDLPTIPVLKTEKENVKALLQIQKDRPICYVPTFKQTKYLRNIIESEDSMRVQLVDSSKCWNEYCPRGHRACLPFFNKTHYVCAQFVNPEKRCMRLDVGAPLVCNKLAVGVMKVCRDNRPMIFQGFNHNVLDSVLRYTNMSIFMRYHQKMTEEAKKRKGRTGK